MALALSPMITELLRELANGRDIEEFIVDLVAERLDTQRRVELYLRLHEDYLRAAEELYNKGDLAQAGEKYWGAVTALLNAIDESRGWEHYSHRDYDVIIGRLYKETKDKLILTNFSMVKRLQANFYHNFMDREEFEAHRETVFELIGKLREFLKNLNKT
ncbi:PaREP1 family protein [Vulcanisaeta sp. JCM 16159]|uniref:PaREP1 family protein n=1 Tax=Vulcanisaeta sp. JCM 16159 TaxID=1295371 RepID=UPI0006D01755|nr:PaREP1 family protein [Vulcanisaeta sp. JCM 16159]